MSYDLSPCSYVSAKESWQRGSPYAVLFFTSCVGQASRTRLTSLLNRLGFDDAALSRRLTDSIVDALLRGGHLFEVTDSVYMSLPSYAIQTDHSEWAILGDARIDPTLRARGLEVDVRCDVQDSSVVLERSIAGSSERMVSLLGVLGTRVFSREDLLTLIPDMKSISAPIPWEGFQPSPFARWEALDATGRWSVVESHSTLTGPCRGRALDEDGRTIATKYFYRHPDGWSPMTTDEARVWTLNAAASVGCPYAGRYQIDSKTLTLDVLLPYSAYLALRFLGTGIHTYEGDLVVHGLEADHARLLCERLAINLSERGD